MKYLARITSNFATSDIYPSEGKVIRIDDDTTCKLQPSDNISGKACEAHHLVHYHAEAVVLDKDGNENTEIGVIDVCIECCEKLT